MKPKIKFLPLNLKKTKAVAARSERMVFPTVTAIAIMKEFFIKTPRLAVNQALFTFLRNSWPGNKLGDKTIVVV